MVFGQTSNVLPESPYFHTPTQSSIAAASDLQLLLSAYVKISPAMLPKNFNKKRGYKSDHRICHSLCREYYRLAQAKFEALRAIPIEAFVKDIETDKRVFTAFTTGECESRL